MHFEYTVESGNFIMAGNASSQFKKVLKQLNVDASVIKRIVIALYEGEVNIVAHSMGGVINIEVNPEEISMVLADNGPGIPDIDRAMQIGFSTATNAVREMGFGAGMGLPNMKNNADEMTIESEVGVGTKVRMKVFLKQKSV
jgi:serine/threonine-protein kinase RsbT